MLSRSVEIGESLVTMNKTAAEMEKTRNLYEKVARRGSILYFTMQGMPAIMDMYEYSLNSYLGVTESVIALAVTFKFGGSYRKHGNFGC